MSASPGWQGAPSPRLALVDRSVATGPVRCGSLFWRPLELWHLLSLDAPTVAAVWTAFVGWSAGVRLSRLDSVAMFVAVWILYAADRLLDARPLLGGARPLRAARPDERVAPAPSGDLEERHWFHHRHRRGFRRGVLGAALLLTGLLHPLAAPVLRLYVLLASLLTGWLILVHAGPAHEHGSRRLPKELAVGLFFPAAVFIPTVARAPALRGPLLAQALWFAAVCSLNCLLLYAWEHPVDRSRAHATTSWALRRVRPLLGVTLLTLMLCTAVHFAAGHDAARLLHPHAIAACCAASTALLWLLHECRRCFAPLHLRALADLVLLTPLPVLLCVLVARRW